MDEYKFAPEAAAVLVAAFDEDEAAGQALERLKELHRAGQVVVKDAAVISRDENNKLRIKETHDMSGKTGAAIGAVTGGVLGLLAGPLLVVGALGALVGGLAAKLSDSGIANDKLEEIGRALQAGSSALVVTMPLEAQEAVRKELMAAGAEVISQELSPRVVGELEKHMQEEEGE